MTKETMTRKAWDAVTKAIQDGKMDTRLLHEIGYIVGEYGVWCCDDEEMERFYINDDWISTEGLGNQTLYDGESVNEWYTSAAREMLFGSDDQTSTDGKTEKAEPKKAEPEKTEKDLANLYNNAMKKAKKAAPKKAAPKFDLVKKVRAAWDDLEKHPNYKLSISPGNRKMGYIPSVSLPPIITCPAGAPCTGLCYALKMCRIHPSVLKAYVRNLWILHHNKRAFWDQVRAAVSMSKYFRFHVSGDFPTMGYFKEAVKTAKMYPGTQILAFTKRYEMTNKWIAKNGDLPKNLHIIFSEWGPNWEIPNPYSLPTAAVIFKGQAPADGWKVCGGNCTECACRGCGCWELKKGETIAFYQH